MMILLLGGGRILAFQIHPLHDNVLLFMTCHVTVVISIHERKINMYNYIKKSAKL